jgi:hypothetical protein
MPFPKTYADLISAGFKFSKFGTCAGCHARVEWWHTSSGTLMPMNEMPDGNSEAVTHFATCPYAKSFRKRQAAGAAK